MKYTKLAAGLVGLAVSVGIASNAAFADTIQKTVTLNQTAASSVQFQNIHVGDTVQLQLVNPTNQALTFQTTERLGNEMAWTVPANSTRTVSYTYTQPFSNNVEYMVINPAQNNVIARGVLLPAQATYTTASVGADVEHKNYISRVFSGLGQGIGTVVASPFELVKDIGQGATEIVAAPFEFVRNVGQGTTQLVSAPFGVDTPTMLDGNQVVSEDLLINQDLAYKQQPIVVEQVAVQPSMGQSAVRMETSSTMDNNDGNMDRTLGQDYFRQTITLSPGTHTGDIAFDDLGVGDEVIVTLVNPTDQPVRFETTERLGDELSWVVPANSQRVISFTYNQPFSDDIQYVSSTIGAVQPVAQQAPVAPQQGTSAVRGYW